ncbi:MAG: DUF6438 domain-containing protein [Bacteroidota bacterium]
MNSYLALGAMLFGLCFLAAGCKSSSPERAIKKTVVAEDFLLEHRRTPCFGTCPFFTVTVDASGKVVYTGEMHVEKIGTYTKMIPESDVKRLVYTLKEGNFFELENEYDNERITDLPSVITKCRQNGTVKEVTNRYGAPDSVVALQQKIEAIIGDEGYVKVKEAETD